jgi:acetyltransferase-like isoleucine patch superfamily enzyme
VSEHIRGDHHVRRVGSSRLLVEPPVRVLGDLLLRSDTRVGCFTEFGQHVEVQAADIGRYSEIGNNSTIGATGHPLTWMGVSAFQYKAATWGWHPAAAQSEVIDPEAGGRQSFRSVGPDRAWIGNDVWLGAGVVVLRGVTIGDGCIVAANAVVTKDLPPYTICGGLPAKVIKQRLPDDVRDELVALEWWRYSPNELAGIPFDDPAAAAAALRPRVDAGLEPYDPGFVEIPKPDEPRRRFARFR